MRMSNFQVECPSHHFKIEMTFWIDLVEDGVKYRMKSVRLSDFFLTDLTHFQLFLTQELQPFYPSSSAEYAWNLFTGIIKVFTIISIVTEHI